ncbi:ATPase, histidine kinase-, DNA gyrase B-, and HSP90-like domain containing protein [Coccidioides posadasii C735 delta SOWgp]|uniref:histidine kinase n=1 Tax=Coccidioides posadasii (strain C735) TaxID=222929 RepID=C5PDW7_COCP7|nr:ATPase, histidine kinase-, DNA gyrase B-, and HSP90-like domain containing protein [Coccidioides posadasii C735 delta SOWgp]EER25278.1 ATPase, histidine kinase-, DNA gyrase B-, and HSP90-like domain containing protein [Coccidioides posadasii C735 delta SOWgp]|eukprot:XP_003067423.1 ATPase, histidine kinase-, DNA gyrase B-, and HSP90-like domain containing protein [Coccidioides posadasii C735 delta SOWgp]
MDESDAAASNDPAESNPDPALISSSPPEAVVPKAPIKPIDYVSRFFEAGQSNAIEQLVALKDELRDADTESFWTRLMEGLTTICHAQCAFVAKESHKDDDDDDDDDEDTDVEMLSLDERSSSLLGVAVYYNDGKGFQAMHRDYRYLSWDIPCTSMNHDKVCLVPESLPAVIGKDADRLPFPVEAYLAVPLFSAGRCFAHVGMLWTAEGLLSRDVSWPYLEMILHSLEDLILQHIAVDEGHRKPPHLQRWEELDRRLLQGKPTKTVVNQSNPMAAPAFKPYARSLSHELRTPMQGVVGMLDIMHATVQEKLENKLDPSLVPMFTEFRENIEAVQDSARRAIEAADNIVHAYNLNMQVPDTPQNPADEEMQNGSFRSSGDSHENRPNIFIEGSNIMVNPYKRRRSTPMDWQSSSSPKHRCTPSSRRGVSPRTAELRSAIEESDKIVHSTPQDAMDDALLDAVARRPSTTRESQSSRPLRAVFPPMVLHYTKVRDLLRLVINESLQVGGRPDSARVESTDCGERIEVQTLGCNGQASTKYIDWWVDPSVPESLCVDEKDLTKLVSCVFLNALKFTEVGEITVAVTVGGKPPCVLINVKDTGTGIPEAFLPKLFKPWAREDGSTTRSKEGLGLGLMVAKGLSRKLGGDLVCVRSSTTEPNRGSEFQIRLPLFPSDSVSRPPTPYTNSSTPRSTAPSVGTDGAHSPPTDQPKPKINGEVSSPLASPTLPDTKDPGQQNGVHQSQMIRRLSGNSKPIPLMRHTCDKTLAKRHPLTFLVAEDNKINRRILVNMLAKLGYSDVYEAFDGKEAVRIVSEILSSQASSPPPSTPSAPISTRSRSNSDITLPNTPVNQPPSNHSTLAMDPANPTQTQSPPDSDQEADKTLPSTKDYKAIDLVLMDLWMPDMDGYEATEKIFALVEEYRERLANIDLNADGHGQTSQPVSLGPPTVFAVSADVTDEALDRANRVGMAGYMTKPYKLRDLERLIEEFCSARER